MQANWSYYQAWMEPERLARKPVDAVAERAPWAEPAVDEGDVLGRSDPALSAELPPAPASLIVVPVRPLWRCSP
jgi:hypothetical protein